MRHTFIKLDLGLLCLLLIATLTGQILRRIVSTPGKQALVANMNQRTASWWVMIAILILAFSLGQNATILLFAILSFLSLREVLTLIPGTSADHTPRLVTFYVLIPLQYVLISTQNITLFSCLIPVVAFLLLPALRALTHQTDHFLTHVAQTQWALMITVFSISHIPALLMLTIRGYENQNILLVFYLILVVQISDVLQYVFGTAFGKRRIAPVISPGKTLEGLLGGGACATAIGASLWWITPFTPPQSAILSLIIVLMGFLGGLVMSAIKRSLNVKDWGTLIKGHGGMMDRLDSLCFSGPVFFCLVRYFFT